MKDYLFTKELVDKAHNGDLSAQTEMYHKLRTVMLPIARYYFGNNIIVSEMIQDANIKILKRLDKIHHKALIAYAKLTVRNGCIDWLRSSGSKVKRFVYLDSEFGGEGDYLTPLDRLIAPQEADDDDEDGILYDPNLVWDKLHKAINNLSPVYQKVFKMYYLDEMPVKEIANELGTHKGSTKSNLFRARANMKEKLGSYDTVMG